MSDAGGGSTRGLLDPRIAKKLAELQSQQLTINEADTQAKQERIDWIDEHAEELGVEKSAPRVKICPSCFTREDHIPPHRPKCKIKGGSR